MRLLIAQMSVCLILGSASLAQNEPSSACQTSSVADAWGPEFASQAKDFFTTLQEIIRTGRKKQFASLIQYPVHVYGGSKLLEIANPSEFARRYSLIITPDAKEAILTQSPTCLFGNWQGVMAAGGRLWFQKQKDGKFKIIGFNIVHLK